MDCSSFLTYDFATPELPPVKTVPNFYSLHFISSGKGYFQGKRLKHGQGFLSCKGSRVCYYPDSKDAWTYAWLTFESEDTFNEIASLINFDSDMTFNFDISKPYFDIIKKAALQNINLSPEAYNYSYFSLYYLILKYLCCDTNKKSSAAVLTNIQTYAARAKRDIDTSYYIKNYSIQNIADKLYISSGYLRNAFQKCYGISPKKHLMNLRMRHACSFLKNTNYPISEIASLVGYSDALMFSKIFKTYFNMSPSQYRKNPNDIKQPLSNIF